MLPAEAVASNPVYFLVAFTWRSLLTYLLHCCSPGTVRWKVFFNRWWRRKARPSSGKPDFFAKKSQLRGWFPGVAAYRFLIPQLIWTQYVMIYMIKELPHDAHCFIFYSLFFFIYIPSSLRKEYLCCFVGLIIFLFFNWGNTVFWCLWRRHSLPSWQLV